MKLKKIHEIRTNHFKDKQMAQKFDSLWNEASKYIQENQALYGIYSDYESNYKGDYTIGAYVEDQIGDFDLNVQTAYKSFEVDIKDPIGVFNTWNQIWREEEDEIITRAYTYDFEKYDQNGLISIHIAIK